MLKFHFVRNILGGGHGLPPVRGVALEVLLFAVWCAAPQHAPAATAFALNRVTNVTTTYAPGGTVDVTVTLHLTTDDTLTALGLEEQTPTGWSYAGTVSGTTPSITPLAGAQGLLEFAWFPLPTLPVTFTYRLNIPMASAGTRLIRGQGICRVLAAGEVRTALISTAVPGEGSGPFHSADPNGDNLIALPELLRIIQFFNSAGLHCAVNPGDTEDGYIAGPGANHSCAAHSSDYEPLDWTVTLNELLRTIQFYNTPGYHPCPEDGTEDGFCPGLD